VEGDPTKVSQEQGRVLKPEYMTRFTCIGPACEDNCCISDWYISVDRKTYKKYQACRDKKTKPLFDKYIVRNRSNATDLDYASIKFDDSRQCPFLTTEKWCSLQKQFGEEFLSYTCLGYPRNARKVNDTLEESASVSCPEVARVALLNKGKMEFTYCKEAKNKRRIIHGIFNSHDPSNQESVRRYIGEIRSFSIDLLQAREYELSDRLVLLGLFIEKISKLSDAKEIDKIPEAIHNFAETVAGDSLKESLATIAGQYVIQMELLKELADIRFRYKFSSEHYLECFAEFLEGIGYSSEKRDIDTYAKNYKEAYEKYYLPFMKDHDYILENYLVNNVFKNVFPFGTNKGMFEEYTMLVLSYSLVKMLLIGMAAYHKGLTEALVIKLMHSFSKTVEHNLNYMDDLQKAVIENNFNSMPYMAIMAKN